mgnify:CR=1 FL=1|tara:strand:+ start:3432 stop:4022 length:591 start_codon:yes stop_codon:yes gene_type:complete
MNCVLTEIHKKHSVWLDIVKSFNVNDTTSKDVVSEMYLNVHKHVQEKSADVYYNDDEINYYFIYICLRNLVYDLKRKEKKVSYSEINDKLFEAQDEEYTEIPDLYKKLRTIIEWYENPEYLDMLENDIVLEELSSDKMHVFYLRRIFKEIYLDGKKLAKFSRETKITYWSLRNTLKTIKKQIKNEHKNRHNTRNHI